MEIVFEDSAKNEVWTVLRELNDCWTKGNATNLSNFLSQGYGGNNFNRQRPARRQRGMCSRVGRFCTNGKNKPVG